MNAHPQTISPWLPAVLVVIVVAVVIGFLYLTTPLQPVRPYQTRTSAAAPERMGSVESRLWQDPVQVVEDHWGGLHPTQRSSVSLAGERMVDTLRMQVERNKRHEESDTDGAELRLVVMMPGGPYAYDRETRRRQRHAVVSALTQYDYVPESRDTLNYFVVPRWGAPSPNRDRRSSDPILVGYERYVRGLEPSGPKIWTSIRVLWLNSQDFVEYPLQYVAALLLALEHGGFGAGKTVLLGPADSDDLATMVRSAGRWPASFETFWEPTPDSDEEGTDDDDRSSWLEEAETRLAGLEVLSPSATAPLDWLFCEQQQNGCTRQDEYRIGSAEREVVLEVEAKLARRLGVGLYRSTIARDDLVLEPIIRELVSRGACKVRGTPTVAVVSEQDTVYGRLLDDIVEDVARRVAPRDCEFEIVPFGYLRGLDGEVEPRREVSGTFGGPTGWMPQAGTATGGMSGLWSDRQESSFGAAQLDYVRRLSVRISEGTRGRSLPSRREDGRGVVRAGSGQSYDLVAVGVFGSDVYDKLLVLQSLRQPLARATFFTTDLDARLTEPYFNRWARNLLVGSGEGLSTPIAGEDAEDIGGGYISRDVYQLAMFRAVTLAVEGDGEGGGDVARWIYPRPRLYEVGRTRAWEVTAPDDGGAAVTVPDGVVDGAMERSLVGVGGLCVPLGLLAVFAWFRWRSLDGREARFRKVWTGVIWAVSGVLAIGMGLAIWRFGGVEPGSFFDGINVVPTLAMQFSAIVCALAVVAWGHGRSADAEGVIEKALVGSVRVGEWRSFRREMEWVGRPAGWVRLWAAAGTPGWGRFAVRHWMREIERRGAEGPATAWELWAGYRRYGRWWRKLVRVTVQTGAAFGVTYAVLGTAALNEHPLLSRLGSAEDLLASAAGIAVLGAMFYCRDTLVVWQAFIWALAREDVRGWGGREKEGDEGLDVSERARRTIGILVRCTELIEPLVVLPLGLGILLASARTPIFDNWNWTTELIVFHVLFVTYALFAAIRFQIVAVHARETLVRRLSEAAQGAAGDRERGKIEEVVEEIQTLRRGAFVPWSQHPVFQSLLVPAGGFALIALLEAWLLR